MSPPLHRVAQRLYARANGYFWLPCPLCGEPFGGHEWRDIDGKPSVIPVPDSPSLHKGICPDCTRAGLGYHHDQIDYFGDGTSR